jgi:hypothetical protein
MSEPDQMWRVTTESGKIYYVRKREMYCYGSKNTWFPGSQKAVGWSDKMSTVLTVISLNAGREEIESVVEISP